MAEVREIIGCQTLNAREAAAYLGIGICEVYRLARSGGLAYIPIGRNRRFRQAELDRYLAAVEVREE